MLPRPPTSTLFPYTTLFRSQCRPQNLGSSGMATSSAWLWGRDRAPLFPSRPSADVGRLGKTDRKSTRLNSSHTVISYAVFCLKKKKRKELKNGILKALVFNT